MKKIKVTLPDGTAIEIKEGSTLSDLVNRLGSKFKKKAVTAKINDKLSDLDTAVPDGAKVEILTPSEEEGKEIYWHSTSHLLAQAVTELYPGTKLGIGPATSEGFYYDFDLPHTLTPEDLPKIEKRMNQIIQNNLPYVREEILRKEAIKLFTSLNQPYKVELLKEIEDEKVTLYRQGNFVDLCLGPHISSTGRIRAFKLLSIAGAYWRGDAKNPMLQRVYGTAFDSPKQLEEYIYRLKEAEKRDHRKLGKELDLFTINEQFGAGLPLWHPKGALVRKIIEDFLKEVHLREGYEMLITPHLAKLDLWKVSGHLDFYQEYMYSPMEIEGQKYVVKPMNCPGHILIYKSRTRSYRELPLRWAELGTVYRFEKSGVLHGLLRVRGFTQDDAHIFCRLDQVEDEIVRVIDLVLFTLKTFGFSQYDVFLSTRPQKYVGTLKNWEKAEEALKKALHKAELAYELDPGEGVFYGPKIDIKIKDALGRSWQCTTIQVDFNLPERFDMTYMGKDNREHRPIMIHRALLGSMERFMGCLIEHYAGAFPTWLAPVQVRIIPIADRHNDYAQRVASEFFKAGVRAEVDIRTESTNRKIRDAQVEKIPYMLVVGDKEVKEKTLALRDRGGKDIRGVKIKDFLRELRKEIESKTPSAGVGRQLTSK